MGFVTGAVVAAGVVASGALAATTPYTPSPPVSLWYQNTLDWTDDTNHNSFLFVNAPLSHADAAEACALYGEQLVSSSTARNDKDVAQLVRYAVSRGELKPDNSFWLSDGSCRPAPGGGVKVGSGVQGPPRPALCTQSARGTTMETSIFSLKLQVNATSPTNGNTYVGFRDLKSFRFLGVPFANPTARFAYSSVADARNTQIEATEYGPACIQPGTGSEDCLYLNIYTPYVPGTTKDKSKLRPVMFWIHGGSLIANNGSDPLNDGGNIASRGDIVLVSIQYRLGSFGFLTVPGTNITGNYGIADQVTALKWVERNIEAFGGDPSRVTIAGQSAGGASVRALLSSPEARGLFHAGVLISSPGGYGYIKPFAEYYTPQQSYDVVGADVIKSAGCTNSSATVACLASAPAESLISSANANFIVKDGKYITSLQLDVRKPGNSAYVPIMIGALADEYADLMGSLAPLPGTNKTAALESVLADHPSLVPLVDASPLFPLPNNGNLSQDVFNLTTRVGTDVWFWCANQATAHSAVRNGVWPMAYLYHLERSYLPAIYGPGYRMCEPPRTATHPDGDPRLPYFKCHTADLHFWFGTIGQYSSPFRDQNDLPFMQLMLDSFSSFVRAHNPNPGRDFLLARGHTNTSQIYAQTGEWSPVTKSVDTVRRLDWPPRQSKFFELEQCKLLGLPVTYYDDASK